MKQEIIELYLPEALAAGVEYDTFWRLNPYLLSKFIKANEKREHTRAWLNGLYFSQALGAAFSKQCKYPDKPMIGYDEVNQTVQKVSPDKARFEAYFAMVNKKFQKKGDK